MYQISKNIILSLTVFQLCWLLPACKDSKNSPPMAIPGGAFPEPEVEAYIAKIGAIEDQLELPGTLVAEDATEILPENSGRLTYLNIREGAFVKKGELLGRIFNDDLKAQLKKLQIQLETAEKTKSRYESLLAIQGVSRQEYDLKVLEEKNIRSEIEILSATLRKTEIRAPYDGILGLKMVSEGAFVTPTSKLTTIRKKGGIKLEFTVPERFLGKCKAGDELLFQPEGGSQYYRARLYASQTSVTESSRSLTWRAEVTGDAGTLLPGTFVKVKTQFAMDSLSVILPSRAIIPQARGKRVVLAKGGMTIFSNVETGRRDSANVEILSGIKPGDTVVLTGLMGMKPDIKIKITKIRN
jgi:membrane fusion protein (multidrug efflux system)